MELDHASRTGAYDINKADFLSTLKSIRSATFTVSTIRSGWRRTGLHPFKPDLVVDELKTREQVNAEERRERDQAGWERAIHQQDEDWDVSIRRSTPDLQSSEVEAALGDTPIRSIKRLKTTPSGFPTSMKVRFALNEAQLVKDLAPPADAFMRIEPPAVSPPQAIDHEAPTQRFVEVDGLLKVRLGGTYKHTPSRIAVTGSP